ncbi:MAG TPA: glycosyltransferase family 4 protein [Mycobacteriales bacterium]|nr:glycosyltransferase family 4 protein [Mycobacteriales bacterium]
MTRVLVVTNDFPPRPGGIQMFVHALAARLPDVVVYAPAWRGDAAFDAAQRFPVVRHPTSLMLPLPTVLRRVRAVARDAGCTAVWFGAAAPLALLAPQLRAAGAHRVVASTHGHETGWAMLPGARQVLRRIGEHVDVLTYLADYTRRRIAGALTPGAAHRMRQLSPGVDTDRFRRGAGGEAVRADLGLTDRPVVVCVSRLVPRKGQDVLVRAMPRIRSRVPDAALLLVGGGPYRGRLERLVDDVGVRQAVRFTGSVPWARLPAYYDAGDVFAMPCRTRNAGLDVEGLGIVYLEASATGLPVVAGASGGAPEAVLDGVTGHVVDGRDVDDVARQVSRLLADRRGARAMGEQGRAWVERQWRWETMAHRLAGMLDGSRSLE